MSFHIPHFHKENLQRRKRKETKQERKHKKKKDSNMGRKEDKLIEVKNEAMLEISATCNKIFRQKEQTTIRKNEQQKKD